MSIHNIKQAFEKAIALQQSGSITQAKEICKDILQEKETSFDTHNLLGVCQYQLEDFENSIKSIERAIELNPNKLDFYINLGSSCSALNQYEKAENIYNKAIEKDQDSDITYNALALIYKNKREYNNALFYFKKAIKVNNTSYIYHYNIADTYNNLGKYELCIFHLQKALKIRPDFYDALYSMAQCYKRIKNERKMLEYLRRTLEKFPKHPAANHLLASYNEETSSEYSSEYAKALFNKYAGYFEDHLLNSLEYQVPFIIKEKLQSLNPPKDSKVLDLGCGTGLVGKTIGSLFPHLVGVDISENMIEETRKKKIYKELYTDNIDNFLLESIEDFGLIIAADVFIYLGDLHTVFSRIKNSLHPNGYFIFTIELSTKTDKINYQLGQSRRFSHTIEYIESLCNRIGFKVIDKDNIVLRQENKVGQKGVIFILEPLIKHPSP